MHMSQLVLGMNTKYHSIHEKGLLIDYFGIFNKKIYQLKICLG